MEGNDQVDMGKIREKIAKLMALGEDARGNTFESEAAMRQAAKLMAKYAIDAAEIQSRTGGAPVYNWTEVVVPLSTKRWVKNVVGWFSSLAVCVAKFTDCKAVFVTHPVYGRSIVFRGDAVDTLYAEYLLGHLRDTVQRQSAAFAGRRANKEAFRVGMVGKIGERMRQIKAEAAEAAQVDSGGFAMAIVNNKLAKRDERFGVAKYSTTKRTISPRGAADGSEAGNHVGFGRGVGRSNLALSHTG